MHTLSFSERSHAMQRSHINNLKVSLLLPNVLGSAMQTVKDANSLATPSHNEALGCEMCSNNN